jgi:DHA3 family tetracycline resistance protein-like MFS transporter
MHIPLKQEVPSCEVGNPLPFQARGGCQQVEVAKLSPLQLVLVGTVLETVCFLSQVPTGLLADVFSRRLSVIVGIFLFGAGFILEGSIPRFVAIAAGQALFGIGATFMDGAEQA